MSATSILINIGARTADAVAGIGNVNKALGEQEKATSKTGAAVKKMAVPAAAAFAAVTTAAMGFAQAAVEDAAGAKRMADNLAKSTGATQDQVDATEDWISAQGRALGVADDDLRPAMERLARSTGDLDEAQKLATLSMDIAAATGKDLQTVTSAVAKANDGQMGALKKLGLTLGDQAQNTIDYTKAQKDLAKAQGDAQAALTEFGPASKEYATAMEKVDGATASVAAVAERGVDWVGELGDQLGGAASSQANTAAGKMERFQLALSETGESIGAALLPAIEALLGPMNALSNFAQDNSTALAIMLGVIGGMAGLVLAMNGIMAASAAVMGVWAAATAAWSFVALAATGIGAAFGAVVAFITSPVVLVVLAILALIAVVVLLWKNWDKVTKALVTAFQWVKGALAAAFNAIKNNIKTIMAVIISVIFPWIGVGLLVVKNWQTIKTTLAGIWASIKTAVSGAFTSMVSGVKRAAGDLLDAVAGLPGKILRAIGNLDRLLYQKGRDLIQGLINGIKSLIGSIGSVIKKAIPDWVPGIGRSAAAPASTASGVTPFGMAAGRVSQNVTINITTSSPDETARAIKRALEHGDVRMGRPRGRTLAVAW